MNILCIGDVVGTAGLDFFCSRMPALKRETEADFVIVNGENSDKSGVGLTRHSAEALLAHADAVTGGNHSLRRCGEELYEETPQLLMPANMPYTSRGTGVYIADTGRLGTVRVISLAGTAWMEPLDNPFKCIDNILAEGEARFTILDFHAESTAEKKALGFYLDGKVSAVFGTHTHVQTADEQILPNGTGYISDVGMTGAVNSVIGVVPEAAVKKQKEHVPVQFAPAEGPQMLNAVLFALDDSTGLCLAAKRIDLRQEAFT